MASQVDRTIPSVLAAHVWVLNAKIGSEKSMSIGQEHMLLLSNVANPSFDYIALGHIHKGQILSDDPPVVYSGSLERLDFGDEKDEKGYYRVNFKEEGGQRKVTYRFHPIDARRFFTLSVDIEPRDSDPTTTLMHKIEAHQDEVRDAIVRLEISIPSTLSDKLRDGEVRNKMKDAYYLTIAKDIKRESRLRLDKGALEGVTPIEALKAYLKSKYPAERANSLLEYGEKFLKDES
jgi:exonuclease SbcD